LLTNALRYTPQGGKIRHSTYPEEDQLVIEVCGSGIGISPEDLPNIFSRLFRGEKSRTAGNGEIRLGLAIAKALVNDHGAQVTAESVVDRGYHHQNLLPTVAHLTRFA